MSLDILSAHLKVHGYLVESGGVLSTLKKATTMASLSKNPTYQYP